MRTNRRLGNLAVVVIFIFLFFLIGFILAPWIFMVCWNAFVPALFHGPAVTFWQSVAIVTILHLIGAAFKSTVQTSK